MCIYIYIREIDNRCACTYTLGNSLALTILSYPFIIIIKNKKKIAMLVKSIVQMRKGKKIGFIWLELEVAVA